MGEASELNDGTDGTPVADLRVELDEMRSRCPVTHTDGAWVVLGYEEVTAAARDADTFSSAVTDRRAIPNSLDGAEHAAYRATVDRYLTEERVAVLEPDCRSIAASLVAQLPRGTTVKTVGDVGTPYAVRAQSAWLGWPATLDPELVRWVSDNREAARSGDRSRTAAVAARFDAIIGELVQTRRAEPSDDVTAELMRESVNGRGLTDDEVISILRNWTAGDLASLATSVGVVVHFLATRANVQKYMRVLADADDGPGIEAAIEEILRIDDPFVSNRRRTTRPTSLAGQQLGSGDLVHLNWTAANRDPLVFGDPDEFDPYGHAPFNLVFGTGPHVCPGRALTLMELRVITETLLRETTWIDLSEERPAVRERAPVSGWARVPVILR